jgi:hypothetical protein
MTLSWRRRAAGREKNTVVAVVVSQRMRYEEVATLMTRIGVGQARCAAGAASVVSVKIRRQGRPRTFRSSIRRRNARAGLRRVI